jgi:hypothetical protein
VSSDKVTAGNSPDPMWDEMHTVPQCAQEQCRHFDGKRCELMGFEPGSICEPAVAQMSEAIHVVLANSSMPSKDRREWLLNGIQMTKEQFHDLSN